MTATSAAPQLLDLAPFDRGALREEPSTVYALTPDLRIGYVKRRFRMRLLPCALGGLLVVHSLLRAAPKLEPGAPPLDALYRRRGMIEKCNHCLQVQRASEPGAWDWVPAYVAHPQPNTSHGLCRLCADYYYSDAVLDG